LVPSSTRTQSDWRESVPEQFAYKSKTGKQDRDRVSGGQDYEGQHVAQEAGIAPEQARQLIKAYGKDREKLMQAAKGLASQRRVQAAVENVSKR
jgi:hypothetical protein